MAVKNSIRCLALLLVLALAQAQTAWDPGVVVPPQQAAKQLSSASEKPLVLFVGFPVLYRAAHIPDAVLAGPASKPEGLEALKHAGAGVAHDRSIILYCGCCPFVKCPNVRPAYEQLRTMGFTHVQVVRLDQNFHSDWVEKGFPVVRPTR